MNSFRNLFLPVFLLVCSTPIFSCNEPAQTINPAPLSLTPGINGPSSPSSPSRIELSGQELTVYYTAVESYHSGSATLVTGCLDLSCGARGDIGSYPSDFVQAVQSEGTGRITSGNHAGNYLNWSYDTGYWLDTAPRDSYGNALVPFVSAAADSNVLARGTSFQISQCGSGATPEVCAQLRSASWVVADEFTPGLGGANHLDLYIGEEDQPQFEATSAKYTTLTNATISVKN